MNNQNKKSIWSAKPLDNGWEVKVELFSGAGWRGNSFNFTFTEPLAKELKDFIKDRLDNFYHPNHKLAITFKRLAKNLRRKEKVEWEDSCDGVSCHYIYLRDYLMLVVSIFIKIKNFLWRIRI